MDIVNPSFLALALRTSLGRLQFQSIVTETAYPVISDDDVENMVVLLPPLGEQQRIVQAYELAVIEFFTKQNEAYTAVANARSFVERTIMSDAAEDVPSLQFGRLFEVEEEATLDES